MPYSYLKVFISLFLFSLILSCEEDKKMLTDTPTKGTINVVVDEAYMPLLDSEKMVFESQYPEAHINLIYKPYQECIDAFKDSSVRMVITPFAIDSSLLYEYFKEHGYWPKTTILGKDAVAIIANNSKKGLKLTKNEVAKICRGEITDFSQLKNKIGGGKITLVFDHTKSSTIQYILDSVIKTGTITPHAFAQKSNKEVMKYVQNTPNAIGVIGVNWISDNQDENNLEFSKSIFPVEISSSDSAVYYYTPHPGYIATHMYPMRRYMNITLKEGGAALGRGFVNFMGSEIGQKIILKAGLVPAKALTRIVETKPM